MLIHSDLIAKCLPLALGLWLLYLAAKGLRTGEIAGPRGKTLTRKHEAEFYWLYILLYASGGAVCVWGMHGLPHL